MVLSKRRAILWICDPQPLKACIQRRVSVTSTDGVTSRPGGHVRPTHRRLDRCTLWFEELLAYRWYRRVVVVCWKTIAEGVNGFSPVVRNRIVATLPRCA
jgi:hypothetical protein